MGIFGFATRMQRFGTRETIGATNTQSTNPLAIVDGSSLAHFLFHSSKHDQKADNTIAPQYSYKAFGTAAIDSLDQLRRYGFEM